MSTINALSDERNRVLGSSLQGQDVEVTHNKVVIHCRR